MGRAEICQSENAHFTDVGFGEVCSGPRAGITRRRPREGCLDRYGTRQEFGAGGAEVLGE